MELPAPPRSRQEVKFFVDESPCERCGHRGIKNGSSSYGAGKYDAICAHCGLRREFRFTLAPGDDWAPAFHLGPEDGKPSRLFTAEQLRRIADRELARAPSAPAELPTMASFREARLRLERGRTALVELLKFTPGNSALAAELGRVVELNEQYEAAEKAVDAKVGAHATPIGLDGRFIAHRKWLDRGRVGDGQMIFRNERWSDISLATPLLTAAVFEDSTFEKINFSNGTFTEAELRRARFLKCDLQMSRFEHVAFEQCDLKGSRLSLSDLLEVVAIGGDWREIVGGRSTWRGRFHDLDLRASRLIDSVLDESTFQGCDLRTVDVSRMAVNLTALGTARQTRFADCDLRGMRVAGWRLDGTVFERCRMGGIGGAPVLEGEVQIIGCDFSDGGEGGADDASSARLLASWRKGAAS